MRVILIIVLSVSFLTGVSQTNIDIDSVLNEAATAGNSKEISHIPSVKSLISKGTPMLQILYLKFSDSTSTNVYSECQKRNLRKGDIAVIIADHIERMPYMLLTGIQNCLMSFCDGNNNFVEYYLYAITENRFVDFKLAYADWLKSKDRKKMYKRKKIFIKS